MTLCLADSSAWVSVFRRNQRVDIRQRLDELLAEGALGTTGMVQLELLAGTRTVAEFDQLTDVLAALHQLQPQAGTWIRAARLGHSLRRAGLTTPLTDVLIAAVALEYEAVILHVDAHFDRIAEHSDLRVESYVNQIA